MRRLLTGVLAGVFLLQPGCGLFQPQRYTAFGQTGSLFRTSRLADAAGGGGTLGMAFLLLPLTLPVDTLLLPVTIPWDLSLYVTADAGETGEGAPSRPPALGSRREEGE